MPHDARGNVLQPGDHVIVPATVIRIHEALEYCNVDLLLDYPMPPSNEKSQLTCINTVQVVKVDNPDPNTYYVWSDKEI